MPLFGIIAVVLALLGLLRVEHLGPLSTLWLFLLALALHVTFDAAIPLPWTRRR